MGQSAVMADEAGRTWPGEEQQRVLRQLDRMVAAGRVTAQEAERLRGAQDADAFEAVMGEIRLVTPAPNWRLLRKPGT